ncbi:MAG TPA: BadF/BadG/BcrA/BcrD ATPase family protein [Candidatus Saccharimonadales bacterium]|nr:BadF/BadG/BcrA/BcrD ATPase family protein [Candidatus Saccharimonadales bacterium]
MPIYLGIDAGGTKTDCAISNGAELLGQATGPTCKLARVGEYDARGNLHRTILQACEAAALPPGEIRQVCIGMAGASVPGSADWVKQVIHELTLGNVNVVGDHIIAHQAAFGRLPGVLVSSGTGSIAYGCNDRGESGRAGGWGASISDQGSAFWIGREAVTAALQEFDQGHRGGLFSLIVQSWGCAGIEDVVRIANTEPNQRLTELAGAVALAAEQGDQAARRILERAGQELAALAGAVITRLWPPDTTVRIVMTGGVLQGSSLVRRALQHSLQAKHSKVAVSYTQVRPVLGALELAARQVPAHV